MRPKQFTECLFCRNSFQKKRSTSKYCCRVCQSTDLIRKGITGRKKKTGSILQCLYCKKDFYVPKYRLEKLNVKYCSRSCLAKVHLTPFIKNNGFKKTGKPRHKYKVITINGKQIREHRWIMEQHLGRKLERWEHVHHINDDSSDNRLVNLIVLSNSDHQKIEIKNRKKPISFS